jgi:hypothetical protein
VWLAAVSDDFPLPVPASFPSFPPFLPGGNQHRQAHAGKDALLSQDEVDIVVGVLKVREAVEKKRKRGLPWLP